jgi:hypothetical protein
MNPSVRSVSVVLTCALLSTSAFAQAKSFAAGNSTGPTSSAKAAPSNPGVHDFATNVRDGILTVDGMVGKAGMNYDIRNGFLYFTIPGAGTAIVAQEHFMNSAPQENAFKGNVLTISVQGHTVELTSNAPLVAGKISEAWVAFDPFYGANITFPQMGFGDTLQRPYGWPGSKAIARKADVNALVTPPPMPKSVQPKPEIASSYTVSIPGNDPKPQK